MARKKGLTREYFGTVGDVYREKGFLAALLYDIKSTFVSLGTKLENLFDSPHRYEGGQYHLGRREIGAGGWPRRSVGEENFQRANERAYDRDERKREYLLRHKKQDSSLAGRVGIFIAFLLGGVALSLTSLGSTGHAISDVTGTTQGLVGVFLFILGLAGIAFGSKR